MIVKHTDITNAKMIVFFRYALLIFPINYYAPGAADLLIFPKFALALFNLFVCPSSWAEAAVPIYMISFVKPSVRSMPTDSLASPLTRLLLS